jgi:hypothetical protein
MSLGATELEAFRQFLDVQIASGYTDLTPEESLALWQENRRDLPESVAALKRSIAEFDAGVPGKPLDVFVAEFRAKHNIPHGA